MDACTALQSSGIPTSGAKAFGDWHVRSHDTQKKRIGLFVVKKNVRKRQRLIVCGRRSNEHFTSLSTPSPPPPSPLVWLVSTEGLGRIMTPLVSRGVRPSKFAATADVKDCFRRVKTPRWMYPFFSFVAAQCTKGRCCGQKW